VLHIGSKVFSGKTVLAPLSGCTDLSFRLIARKLGAKLAFFEMANAKSLLCGSPSSLKLLKTLPEDQPIAAQILGSDPGLMRDAALFLQDHYPIEFIDINAACPVKKVVQRRAGAALLNQPSILESIVAELSSHLNIPVTIKLRTGTEENPNASIILARKCEDAGASALFIHGRSLEEGYAGHVNIPAIRTICDTVKIPVIASGDIFSPHAAKKMIAETGCNGILVARGSLGNPWIIRDIETFLSSGILTNPPSFEEKKTILKEHLSHIETYKDLSPASKTGFMRKMIIWYLKNFPYAAHARRQVRFLNGYQEFLAFIDKLSG